MESYLNFKKDTMNKKSKIRKIKHGESVILSNCAFSVKKNLDILKMEELVNYLATRY